MEEVKRYIVLDDQNIGVGGTNLTILSFIEPKISQTLIVPINQLSEKVIDDFKNDLHDVDYIVGHNIDFDINKFKLRNKYTITKTDVDEKGKSKYEYQNFMDHYKNKKNKEPNKNCGMNEYLLYIITDDIEVWNAKAGDSIILYRNNEI